MTFRHSARPCWRCASRRKSKGTLLLAKEGINGTIAGSRKGVDTVIAWLEQDPRFASLDWKESFHGAEAVSSHESEVEERNRDDGG